MQATQEDIDQAQAQVAALWSSVEAEAATPEGLIAIEADTVRMASIAPRLYAAIQAHGDAAGWLAVAKSGRPLRHTFEQAIAISKAA